MSRHGGCRWSKVVVVPYTFEPGMPEHRGTPVPGPVAGVPNAVEVQGRKGV